MLVLATSTPPRRTTPSRHIRGIGQSARRAVNFCALHPIDLFGFAANPSQHTLMSPQRGSLELYNFYIMQGDPWCVLISNNRLAAPQVDEDVPLSHCRWTPGIICRAFRAVAMDLKVGQARIIPGECVARVVSCGLGVRDSSRRDRCAMQSKYQPSHPIDAAQVPGDTTSISAGTRSSNRCRLANFFSA